MVGVVGELAESEDPGKLAEGGNDGKLGDPAVITIII